MDNIGMAKKEGSVQQGGSEGAREEKQIVLFKLCSEEFGVDINDVREILCMEHITKIPNTRILSKGS
jgi:chemotaxis signal transduction protein